MTISDSYTQIFGEKQKILVIMPHPDDCELYCGGTVARLIQDGKDVRVVKVTFGEKGCRQDDISPAKLAQIREKEDRASMNVLGVQEDNNVYLGLGDGAVEENLETIEVLVKQIREFKPDLIITTNPEDTIIRFDKDINWFNHRDHINVAKSVINASYPYARDISFFPEHLKLNTMSSHICTEFLFTDYYNHEDCVLVDITNTLETRIKAHACHSSQYSLDDAADSAEFFTSKDEYNGKNYEKFRYVVAD